MRTSIQGILIRNDFYGVNDERQILVTYSTEPVGATTYRPIRIQIQNEKAKTIQYAGSFCVSEIKEISESLATIVVDHEAMYGKK